MECTNELTIYIEYSLSEWMNELIDEKIDKYCEMINICAENSKRPNNSTNREKN